MIYYYIMLDNGINSEWMINMTLSQALSLAHNAFSRKLAQDGNAALHTLPFPEFTINCFMLYKDYIKNHLLSDNAPLSLLFSQIGVLDEADPFLLFIHSYYLACHAQDKLPAVSGLQ